MLKHPRLTIYVNIAGPSAPADAKQVEQWINELNSDQFPVREKATGNCRNWAGLPLLIFAKPRKAGQVQSNCGGSTLCST
jgi:hypothetical protein